VPSLELQRDLFAIGALVLAVAVYRFIVLAQMPGPPGSDGGNWLAFTFGLFGDSPKAAESTYFPGALVVLKSLMLGLPALIALKTMAVVSSVLAAVPLYFLARRACSVGIALFVTTLFLFAGYLSEMMTWGGYPQLLATAYMLGALYCLDRWLVEGDRRSLFWGTTLVLFVVATHHFTVLILATVFAVYLPFVLYRERARLVEVTKRLAAFAVVATALSLLMAPWYLRYLSLITEDGALSSSAESLNSLSMVLSYVFSEAPQTWIALAAVAFIAGFLPSADEDTKRLRPIAFALTLGPAIVYAVTDETRAFQPMQAGILLSLGIVITVTMRWLGRLQVAGPVLASGRLTVAAAGLVLMLILVPNGHSRFEGAYDRFGALDSDAVEALAWLRDETPEDAVVLPGHRNGWVSYTWWVEGLAQRPAYGLMDPRFLAFEEEHQQSALAVRLIDSETTSEETHRILEETGIAYLFLYKESGGAFQDLADRVPTTVEFQNDSFVILHFDTETAGARP